MRVRTKLAIVPLAALVLTACGGGDEAPEATDEPTTEAPEEDADDGDADDGDEDAESVARADADLVIWADDTRAPVIEPFAQRFGDEQGISVAVQEVPYEQIRDLVTTQGPGGEGPDVFIGAHDWLGQLAENGVVAPVDLGDAAGDYLEVATQAFQYDGTNYGLPYSTENIALVRNTELAPDAPESLEDLAQTGLDLVEAGDAEIPVGWQQPDPFHDYWVVTGAGGYVFGQDEEGNYDAADLGIDSDGGLAAAEIFGDLAERGVVSADVTYDVMVDTFARGVSPYAITGPWAIADFEAGGVDFVVEPLPPVDGGEAQPFVGVQGFYVSAFADNELAARTFVLDFMGTEEAQLELYEAGNRPPALVSAYEQAQDDEVVAGFGAAGESGYPMPAIPEMNSVWEAWEDAYTNILAGNHPAAAFEEAAEQIRTLIDL
ncbi:maltose ABC transporter substrate-binding protein [Nitriliruptoraceae bacterium ZYF776]|nr:maltose ABC transporter substrate-binding protein [Profundirhabdus halotolerans]